MRKSITATRMATVAGLCALAAATWAAQAVKDPLYGDPSHPNISGMWNPEFVYFGAPLAGALPAAAPGAGGFPGAGGPPPGASPPAGAGGPPAAARFARPAQPKLKQPYADRFAKWRK